VYGDDERRSDAQLVLRRATGASLTTGPKPGAMIRLLRVSAVLLGVAGLFGLVGVFQDSSPGTQPLSLLPISVITLGLAAWLYLRAGRMAARARRVEESRKLLALAGEPGTLTAAQVMSALALTREEAEAALTRMSREGLARFDIDAEGTPIYRVAKLPAPRS